MNVSIVVLSCDIYSVFWDWFFACKKRYWKDCRYPTYLVTETKTCKYCQTIKINSPIWTKRFREALKQINSDYVIVMLEDYFIRQPVNQQRLHVLEMLSGLLVDVAVFNFEKDFRPSEPTSFEMWNKQKNNQIYLNSTQPSWWNREKLIERLKDDQNPWEWELTKIDSSYQHWINAGDQIIDNGYRHGQEFGVKQGKLTDECVKFLKSEGLL
jgi:hypothetical protein